MKYLIRTVLIFCFVISPIFADKFEIKLNGKSIELPYWSTTSTNPHGAVILIHGKEQAQWSTFLESLAKKFTKNGWSAVLLNCKKDNAEPWVKELPEVINTLRQQKNNRIIVLHYGEQLKQTLDAFNKSAKVGIEGLVLLSAYDIPKADDKNPELSMPLFDVSGQFDYELVKQQVNAREETFAKMNYTSVQIPGARHDYEYTQDFLLSFIYGWMSKLAEFKPEPPLVSYIESIGTFLPKRVALDNESDWVGYAQEPEEEQSQEITPP